MRRHVLWISILLLQLSLALPGSAWAQDEDGGDEEEQAAEHFANGRKLYGEGKYQEAIDELLKAFALRPAPPILLNIGRTYEKVGDKVKALEFYRRYLLKARLADPNRATVKALVERLERETGAKAAGDEQGAETPTAATTAADEPKAPTVRQGQLIHTPVDSARVRHPITVQAELPPQVSAAKLVLHFRKQGERRFRHIEMSAQGDAYMAQIPGVHVTTTSMQYYIEAIDPGKKRPVATAGSDINPHIVVIEGGRAPGLGNAADVEIRSPYRTWMWVGAAGSAALLGGGIATALLASDRASAVEVAASGKNGMESFDRRARDWESQGKTFATTSKVLIGFGIAAAGATGFLWYLDRQYIQKQRRELSASIPSVVRFSGAPWAAQGAGGFIGRIDF